MPIIGLIRENGILQKTDDVMDEVIQNGECDGYPITLLNRALSDWPKREPTASQIAGSSWRRTVLEALVDYYIRMDNQLPLLRGSLIHGGFETFPVPNGVKVVREKRMRVRVPGQDVMLSGQIDLYIPGTCFLIDYKTASQVPNLIKADHINQLAIYLWLLRWTALPVAKAGIAYMTWDNCQIVTRADLGQGRVGEVIDHPLLLDDGVFIEFVMEGYRVLADGFSNCVVPSMRQCDLRWCRYCSVKWACDAIEANGERIRPEDYNQELYQ